MSPFEFCIPIVGTKVPAGPEWLHEIKYDGYRLRLERDGDRVRLITKGALATGEYDCNGHASVERVTVTATDRRRDGRHHQSSLAS